MTRATIPWNVNQVARAAMNGSIVFNNAIQRAEVWKNNDKSLLIDTTIRGLVVPPIYLIKTNDKVKTPKGEVAVYDCIDGKQRCLTFMRFLNDEFALTGLKPFIQDDGTEIDLNGKKFSELDEETQDTIKSYGLSINYFTDAEDEDVSELMSRLNGGKSLTGVENARIKAKNLKGITYLAGHSLFTDNFSESAIKGYKNEDIVMKLALQTKGDTDLSTKNVKEAYETYEFSYEDTDAIKAILDDVNSIVMAVKTDVEDKKVKKNVLNRIIKPTNLLAVLYAIYRIRNGQTSGEKEFSGVTTAEFARCFEQFYNGSKNTVSDEYNDACTNGTMHSSNVEARNEALMSFIEASSELPF